MSTKLLAASRSALGAANRVLKLQALAVRNPAAVRDGVRSYGSAAELAPTVKAPVTVQYSRLLIDGEFVDSASGKTFSTVDPRTEETIVEVAEGAGEDVNLAVKSARRAVDEGPWIRMPAYERVKVLLRFADLLEKHTDELAGLDSLDVGKPYDATRFGDMHAVVRTFHYFAGWADKIHGATIPADGSNFAYTLHEPVGVVGTIVPWNFPMIMFANQVAPALALGNSVILKPAEQSPLSALLAGKLALEAGVPPGVLNIIPGYGQAGAAISSHHDVDVVSFTGSTEVGKKVLEAAARSNLKRLSLELGGKNAFIVCNDADVDEAVALSQSAVFYNAGQVCASGSRTFVQEGIYDRFLERAQEMANARKVGDPFLSGTEQGPQVDETQFRKVLDYIKRGQEQGATLVAGGSRVGSKGYFIQPTVFGDVGDSNVIFQEEIFGPVQSVSKFKTIEEVIERTNASPFGLTAGVMSKNMDTVNTISRALKVGTVWVNCYNVLDATLPFGGYKQSGFGRVKGEETLKNYYNVKVVVTPLHNSPWL